MSRERLDSGTPWEDEVGYSRAVKVGDRILVSGTTATVVEERPDDDVGRVGRSSGSHRDTVRIVGENDAYKQAVQAFQSVVAAIEELGGSADDVVRTRIYVTNIDLADDVGRAHAKVFGDVRPASTLVEISRLVDDRMLVEVEAEAIVDEV